MRFKRRVSIFRGQLELTPFVDVVLLLLIFFLLSSSYVFSPGIKVDLPESTTSSEVKSSDLVITVTKRREVRFRDKLISPANEFEQLRSELQKVRRTHGEETPRVILRADRDIPLGLATQIMGIAQDEGFFSLAIATQQKELE
ncbi:MAG: biopolymer transporter ExbD [Verrucomicrobia bacterium]|nr:biopolymer transporter ExbD [Verrucomicrobiota bacterium]